MAQMAEKRKNVEIGVQQLTRMAIKDHASQRDKGGLLLDLPVQREVQHVAQLL